MSAVVINKSGCISEINVNIHNNTVLLVKPILCRIYDDII